MLEQPMKAESPTGFEGKLLKVVIQNWLYSDDISVVMDTTTELRRRFSKVFTRPTWAIKENNGGA
jgi:hypothetical protein